MMESFKHWLSIDAPTGWADLFVRTVKVAAVAFVVLQLKELYDAGSFDTLATAVDAVLIAGGTFVLNALGSAKNRVKCQRGPRSLTARGGESQRASVMGCGT